MSRAAPPPIAATSTRARNFARRESRLSFIDKGDWVSGVIFKSAQATLALQRCEEQPDEVDPGALPRSFRKITIWQWMASAGALIRLSDRGAVSAAVWPDPLMQSIHAIASTEEDITRLFDGTQPPSFRQISIRRHGGFGARQNNAGEKPGRGILQRELPPMQRRDRGHN